MSAIQPVTGQLLASQADRLGLRLVAANAGYPRPILRAAPLRPALAPEGGPEDADGAVVLLGVDDLDWLRVKPPGEQAAALRARLGEKAAAIIVCRGLFPPKSVLDLAAELGMPLFLTRRPSTELARELEAMLAHALAAREVVHGVLVQVHNLGVLLVGHSGIGKSETALELVQRGHRLVADDVVDLSRAGPVLLGQGREGMSHYLEVRGLGVLHAADLFGQAAVLEKTALHLVVELSDWRDDQVTRTGLDDLFWSALGVEVPLVRLPVRPGRNIALLVEVAARNQILKRRGIHSARRLDGEINRRLESDEGDPA
jgi:HPr kinase/phosphorylase